MLQRLRQGAILKSLLLCLCLSPLSVFAQNIEDEIEVASLLLRAQTRLTLFRDAEYVQENSSFTYENAQVADAIENATRQIVERELQRQELLTPLLKRKLNSVWASLRKANYWSRLKATFHNWNLDFRSQFVLNGVGYSTAYLAMKSAGIFLGGFAWLTANTKLLIALNSFSWNTLVAIIVDFPYRTYRYYKLGDLAGNRENLNAQVLLWMSKFDSEVPVFPNEWRVPFSFLAEEALATSKVFNFFSFQRTFLRQSDFKILKNELREILNEKKIEDVALLGLLSDKEFDQELKVVAILMRLQNKYPEIAEQLSQSLKLKGNGAPIKLATISKELSDWVIRINDCDTEEKLRELYLNTPQSLSLVERADLWTNLVMPSLAKKTNDQFRILDLRQFYLKIEEKLAEAIRIGVLGPNETQLKWTTDYKFYFPLVERRSRVAELGKFAKLRFQNTCRAIIRKLF